MGGTPPYMFLSSVLMLLKIKVWTPKSSYFCYSRVVKKKGILIIVVKNYTSSAAALIILLTWLWENIEGKSFSLQKLLIVGTKNPLTFE